MLIIEDNESLLQTLADKLERESFIVDTASEGNRGSYLARTNEYDLIVLDNNLPKKNGEEICKEVRAYGRETPILVISNKIDPDEKVILLDAGADDYISKPFSFLEFLSRTRALLRRPHRIKSNILTLEDITLDTTKQKITKEDKEIFLTRKEYLVFECLMMRQGEVISRGELIEKVWDAEFNPFSNSLESHILNLRKKIGSPGRNNLLRSVPGRGYKLQIRK